MLKGVPYEVSLQDFMMKRYKQMKVLFVRFAAFKRENREGLAIARPNGELYGLLSGEEGYPSNLDFLGIVNLHGG
jgi:hypothetical protein